MVESHQVEIQSEAQQSSPYRSQSHGRQIQDLLNRRDFEAAERLIRQDLLSQPQNPDLFYWLGVMYYFQGQVPLAVDHLKKALVFNPRHTDAAVCLSVLYNDIGKYDEARQVFEQANQSIVHTQTVLTGELTPEMRVNRKFAVKHLELADLYVRYRRYDEGIDEYTKAIQLDPLTHEVRIRRAKAYAKKGFWSRSIQELQQLKSDEPLYAPARLQLGLLHYGQGNLLDAELEWESVIQFDPDNREAQSYLAMADKARASGPVGNA